jgi:Recombination endonuclease VII
MTCGVEKRITEFYMRDKKTGRRHSVCKECDKARVKARHQANPERTRNNDLKRNYGITLQEHQEMYESQSGRCAICKKEGDGKWKKLCVDHDHETGKVRQLLCRRCNMILGQVYDNISLLEEHIKYLQKHKH